MLEPSARASPDGGSPRAASGTRNEKERNEKERLSMSVDVREMNERIRLEAASLDKIVSEIRKVIVGQRSMVDRLMVGLLGNGHVLLEGVPGLAKTLAVTTLAKTIRATLQRIQ